MTSPTHEVNNPGTGSARSATQAAKRGGFADPTATQAAKRGGFADPTATRPASTRKSTAQKAARSSTVTPKAKPRNAVGSRAAASKSTSAKSPTAKSRTSKPATPKSAPRAAKGATAKSSALPFTHISLPSLPDLTELSVPVLVTDTFETVQEAVIGAPTVAAEALLPLRAAARRAFAQAGDAVGEAARRPRSQAARLGGLRRTVEDAAGDARRTVNDVTRGVGEAVVLVREAVGF